MSEDNSSPELDIGEKKPVPDLDDKNDKDMYSNGSNSEISVYDPADQNRFYMKISIVVATGLPFCCLCSCDSWDNHWIRGSNF